MADLTDSYRLNLYTGIKKKMCLCCINALKKNSDRSLPRISHKRKIFGLELKAKFLVRLLSISLKLA